MRFHKLKFVLAFALTTFALSGFVAAQAAQASFEENLYYVALRLLKQAQ
jgi:hypothetical protein